MSNAYITISETIRHTKEAQAITQFNEALKGDKELLETLKKVKKQRLFTQIMGTLDRNELSINEADILTIEARRI
jgi:hypothetical protein